MKHTIRSANVVKDTMWYVCGTIKRRKTICEGSKKKKKKAEMQDRLE